MLTPLLLLCSSLSNATQWTTEDTTVRWAGGRITFERARWGEIPLDGPPLVVWSEDEQGMTRRLRALPRVEPASTQPVVSEREAAERVAAGWGEHPLQRGTLTLFPDGDGASLTWRFHVAQAGQTWRVWVDAEAGTVVHAQPETWSARVRIYDPNPVDSDILTEDLLGLQSDQHLAGVYSEVGSCAVWSIDPRPFGDRTCLEWAPQAKASLAGDFLYAPSEGDTHDPFTEGQVYFHLHEFAHWANTNFGLRLDDPIQVFTNFPLTNAFFGDFDGDGVRDLSFGISDDGYNFGHDADVIVHEYGHALVRQMAGSMWMQADELGLDWTPGALNEGVADTFAMIHNPDPILAEAMARSDRWEKGIRDLSVERSCPGDLQSQVHRSGRVWGSTMWRLVAHPSVGPDVVSELLVGAVSTWSNDTDWPDAGRSFVAAAQRLLDVGAINEETRAIVEETIEASGMTDCERIVDLSDTGAMRLSLLNYGLGGEYERVPAGVQFKHPIPSGVDRVRVSISDFSGPDLGTGLAVYLRMDAPIQHETTRVEGLGLHHAIPTGFDAVFELDASDGEIWVDADSLPGFAEGGVLHGSLAAVNRSRGFMDVTYASVVVHADAYMAADRVDVQENAVTSGCATTAEGRSRSHVAWLSTLMALVVCARRRGVCAHRTP